MRIRFCRRGFHIESWVAIAIGFAGFSANAAVEVLGVQYQQDNPYPEYRCWYSFGNYPTSCGVEYHRLQRACIS